MKKNDVVVLTTIFRQDLLYVNEYFESLAHQTYQLFDVIVVNDGFNSLEDVRARYSSMNIIEFTGVGNIAKNRELLINNAIELAYSKAIFADFDDYFSLNRLNTSVALLNQYDVVVNDLALVVDNTVVCEQYIASVIPDGQEIFLKDVLESNFFGLSNTALRLSSIQKVNFDGKLRAVDWFFFSKVLIDGARAVFTNQCVTYYRQHENNIANIGQINSEQLINEINVKTIHYSLLVQFSNIYKPLLEGITDLNKCLNTQAFENYFRRIEKQTRPPFWWNIFNLNEYWRTKNEIDR